MFPPGVSHFPKISDPTRVDLSLLPGIPAQMFPPQRRIEPHGTHGTGRTRRGAQEAKQRPAQLLAIHDMGIMIG